MNARINLLIDEALTLKHDERSALVVALLDSLEVEKQPDIADAWASEIAQRKKELADGTTKAIDWEQAKAKLLAL
jgi:putative addiction module component (TIGR02574 family)